MWEMVLLAGLIGTIFTTVLIAFWDNIKEWLNNVAANAVEKALGYNARQGMHRAVSLVDRVMDKIRNRTVIYTKKNKFDFIFDKTTIVGEAPVYSQSQEIIDNIEKDGQMTQEFIYKQ